MIKDDELFRMLIKNKHLHEYDRDAVIKDVLKLQDLLSPLGIIKEDTDVHVLKDKSLIMVLMWQHELFAIKHFQEAGKNPPTQNILGVYV